MHNQFLMSGGYHKVQFLFFDFFHVHKKGEGCDQNLSLNRQIGTNISGLSIGILFPKLF